MDSTTTLGPNSDAATPSTDVECPHCGATTSKGADPTAERAAEAAVCSQCGELLDTSAGADANAADIQFDASGGIAGTNAAEEYVGDDIRSASHADERRTITRQVEFRSVEGGDGLTIEGYAAVFDDPAMIRDQHGEYRETISRGSFAKTIAERRPALLFDHGQHPMIGTMPIGQITLIREDAKGLFIRGRLSDNWLVQPVRDALRDGAVRGMSIRADVIKDDWTPNLSDRVVERSVKELALKELGPVVFPAYENTSVSVRSAAIAAELADPDVRAEVARAALGTEGQSAATRSTNEPAAGHSLDSLRRRAVLALLDS